MSWRRSTPGETTCSSFPTSVPPTRSTCPARCGRCWDALLCACRRAALSHSVLCVLPQEVEENVAADMTRQMNWHLQTKPVASMLKFRLPYASGKTEYLDGEMDYDFPTRGAVALQHGAHARHRMASSRHRLPPCVGADYDK